MSPLDAIRIAITRQPLDGSEPPFLPQQRVSLPQILRAYTIDDAWLSHQESVNGSFEVGKAADLIALDRNLFVVQPATKGSVRVTLTLPGGRQVYQGAGFHF